MTDQLTQQDIPVISVKDHICIVRSLFMADELLTLSLPNETAANVCVLFFVLFLLFNNLLIGCNWHCHITSAETHSETLKQF